MVEDLDILRFNLNKDMLAQLFAGIPDLTLLLKVERTESGNEQFRYVMLNPAARDAYIFREDPMGKTIEEVVPELAATLNERYRRVLRTRKSLVIEHNTLFREGRPFGRTVVSPVFEQGGEITHILTVVEDEADVHETEHSLKITQDLLYALMNGTRDAIVIWNADGTILQVNDSFRRMFHYMDRHHGGQLTGEGTFFSKENQRHIADLSAMIKRGDQVGSASAFYVTENGKPVYVDVTYFSLRREDGEIYAYTGIYRDITQEKLAVTASLANERRYKLITENMTDLILLTDATGVIQYASPSFQHVLGLQEEQVLGKSVLENIDRRDAPKVSHMLVEIRKQQTAELVEFRYLLPRGSSVWVQAKCSLFWENGTPYILIAGRDMTEHKAHEERTAMLAYNDPLTGAPNQKMFRELLKQAIYAAERYGHPLAVVYLDLAAEKELATVSEGSRDGLLRAAVMLMELSVGKSGVVTRVAGGEFLLLYQELKQQEGARGAVERLLRQLALLTVPGTGGQPAWRAAAGVAMRAAELAQPIELIESAQMALYRALDERELRLAVFEPESR